MSPKKRSWDCFGDSSEDGEVEPPAADAACVDVAAASGAAAPVRGRAARPERAAAKGRRRRNRVSDAGKLALKFNAVCAQKGRTKANAKRRETFAHENVDELKAAGGELADASTLEHTAPFLDDVPCMQRLIEASRARSCRYTTSNQVTAKNIVNSTFLSAQARGLRDCLSPSAGQKLAHVGVKRSFDSTTHFLTLRGDDKYQKMLAKLRLPPSCLRALRTKKNGTEWKSCSNVRE